MTKYIAIRKQTRSQSQGSLTVSADEGRGSYTMVDDYAMSKAESLKSVGLTDINQWSYSDQPDPNEKPFTNCFEHLGHLDTFVVDVDNEGTTDAVMSELSDEYLVIPDIELNIPMSTPLERKTTRRPRREHRWPEPSGVTEAHKNNIRGQNVIVGVLDTGCDADHLELRRKRINFTYVPLNARADRSRNIRGFDTHGHGTHVSAIIAGRNIGVAPDVDLMAACVIESETQTTSLRRITVALDWMLEEISTEENMTKPAIINMSLGFFKDRNPSPAKLRAIQGMERIIAMMVDDFDVLPIVAIGNEGPGTMRIPGAYPETLSVGAVNDNLVPADFSGGGPNDLTGKLEPNVVGYGVSVFSAVERSIKNRSIYGKKSGTSMATPYVSGIAALAASHNQNLTGQRLRKHIIDNALPINEPEDRVGAGLARFVS
ncbi:MAG: S8 family serine peptidase [Chloroflexota bacterium]